MTEILKTSLSPQEPWLACCDGASRGNPGPASFGVVLCDPTGAVCKELSVAIGRNTNQAAEYEALIRTLEELVLLKVKQVKIFTDSQFVARQFSGEYRVKDERMKVYLSRVRGQQKFFDRVDVVHILRSSHPLNKRADQLANEALDRK